MKLSSLIPATGGAVATTFSLFYMMQGLVAGGDVEIDPAPDRIWFDPVQRIEPVPVREKDRLVRPKDPEPKPDPVDPPTITDDDPRIIPRIPPPTPPRGPGLPDLKLAQMDGERIPLVRIAPTYPRRCQERGISGWVVLDFDVTKFGTVENATVIDADPSGCFNRAALKTIMRFKYKPTIMDGQPRRSSGVRFRMGFEMAEG